MGIRKTISALTRWSVSYNLRPRIVAQTYAIYSHRSVCTLVHTEDTKSRQSRDTDDEMLLVAAFKGFKVFVSVTPESLKNLVTKDLATDKI